MRTAIQPDWRTMKAERRVQFPTKPCERCGGCGKYSYNQIHGSVCYGCNGRGWKFTYAGARAWDGLLAAQKALSLDEVLANPVAWRYHATLMTGSTMTSYTAPVTKAVREEHGVHICTTVDAKAGAADGVHLGLNPDGTFPESWLKDFTRQLTEQEVEELLRAHPQGMRRKEVR